MKIEPHWIIGKQLNFSRIYLLVAKLNGTNEENATITQFFLFDIGFGRLHHCFGVVGIWFYIGGYKHVVGSERTTIGFTLPLYREDRSKRFI